MQVDLSRVSVDTLPYNTAVDEDGPSGHAKRTALNPTLTDGHRPGKKGFGALDELRLLTQPRFELGTFIGLTHCKTDVITNYTTETCLIQERVVLSQMISVDSKRKVRSTKNNKSVAAGRYAEKVLYSGAHRIG